MNCKSIGSLAAICALILLCMGAARAETQEPADAESPAEATVETGTAEDGGGTEESTDAEPMSDEAFAKTLIGETYAGNFDVDGWTNVGGGLVLPPIYVQHYTRDDGTVLVLTAKSAKEDGSSSDFEITDALVADKPRKGYTFSTACMKGDDYTLRFMGEASGKDAAEWWTNLRNAWEIDVETGKISSVNARGVKCTNPNW
jgi:hypothetical protein